MNRRDYPSCEYGTVAGIQSFGSTPVLHPMNADPARIVSMDLCTRPFRASGPRQELEKIGSKHLIHNYGHGGSGWSLSWGSAEIATEMARQTGAKNIAVIGCGAIGLTTAVLAQRKHLKVTIYTGELPPTVPSYFATGIWSPDSRICTQEYADSFADTWEKQTRFSHHMFQNLLRLDDTPVEYKDLYELMDSPMSKPDAINPAEPGYPDLSGKLITDISPGGSALAHGNHPFPAPHVRHSRLLQFNIPTYSQHLMESFSRNGGQVEITYFMHAGEFNALPEKTLINCTGFGARELLGDDCIIPVRGQTAKLLPQPEVSYGIRYASKRLYAYSRSDGLLLQAQAPGDYGNQNCTIDTEETLSVISRLKVLMAETMNNQQRDLSNAPKT